MVVNDEVPDAPFESVASSKPHDAFQFTSSPPLLIVPSLSSWLTLHPTWLLLMSGSFNNESFGGDSVA